MSELDLRSKILTELVEKAQYWAALDNMRDPNYAFIIGQLMASKIVLVTMDFTKVRLCDDWVENLIIDFMDGYSDAYWLADFEIAEEFPMVSDEDLKTALINLYNKNIVDWEGSIYYILKKK